MQLCKAEIVQKAIELISNSTLSNYKIAKDTGITEASIGNYRNGNTRPTLANANIIIDYFNKKELELSGSNLVINTETEYKEAMEKGLKLLPEVDFKFSGGNAELLGSTDSVKRYWYLPDCKDCEAIAQVAGNSMAPAYPSGCWIALRKSSLIKFRLGMYSELLSKISRPEIIMVILRSCVAIVIPLWPSDFG